MDHPASNYKDATGAALIAGSCLFGILGYHALTSAMRMGEVSAVTPFRYTRLVFALILGFAVFGSCQARVNPAGDQQMYADMLAGLVLAQLVSQLLGEDLDGGFGDVVAADVKITRSATASTLFPNVCELTPRRILAAS